MFVRVREGQEVRPVFRIEACQRGEDEYLFVFAGWESGRSQVVELIVYDRRWSLDSILILHFSKGRGRRRQRVCSCGLGFSLADELGWVDGGRGSDAKYEVENSNAQY